MIRNSLLSLVTGIFLVSCSTNDTALIKKVFNNFNEANISKNGELVYELSSAKTHKYFAEILNHARNSDSITVLTLGFVDKLNVLSARAMITNDELLTISPKDFMIKMYSPTINSMDDNVARATRAMQLKNITSDGISAKAELAPGGRSLTERAFVEFTKENEQWKYNHISIHLFTEQQILQMIIQNGLTEQQIIDLTFADPTIQKKLVKPVETIWTPVTK